GATVARHVAQSYGSGELSPGLELAGRAVRQLTGLEVDLDLAAAEVAADQFFRQRILDIALDPPPERPPAVRTVFTSCFDNPVHHFRRQHDAQLAVDQVVVELIDQQAHDAPQVVVSQRLEDDDLVDAVDELGVEGALHFAEHHVRHALADLVQV